MSDRVRVARVEPLTAEVTQFVLVARDGDRPLRPYTPGSHLVVDAGGLRNAYSLTGSGIAPRDYRISVRRSAGERATSGSQWLHRHLAPGVELDVEGPTSSFAPQLTARKSLLVAAGMGITPVLSHLRAARAWGRAVEVVYGYSGGGGPCDEREVPHLDDVRALAGADLIEARGRRELAQVLRERFADQPWGTHAHACGPTGMLEAFTAAGREAGWPPGRLHVERFVAPELDPGRPFTARLARSGGEVVVASGASLLDAVLARGVQLPHQCRQGVCGRCLVTVCAGAVEHRDVVLTPRERERGELMLACVSRAADDHLEVDL